MSGLVVDGGPQAMHQPEMRLKNGEAARDRLFSLAEKSQRVGAASQRYSCYTPETPLPRMGLRAKDKAQRTSMYASEHSLPDKLSMALRALRPSALAHSASNSAPFRIRNKESVVDAGDDLVFIPSDKAPQQHKYQKSPNTFLAPVYKRVKREIDQLHQKFKKKTFIQKPSAAQLFRRKAKSVFVRNSPSQSDLTVPVKDPTLKSLDHIRSLYKSVPNVNTLDDDYGEHRSFRDDYCVEFSSSTRSPTDSGYRSTPRHLTEENPYSLDDEAHHSGIGSHKSTTVVTLNGPTPSSPSVSTGRSSRVSEDLRIRCTVGTPASVLEQVSKNCQATTNLHLPFNERDVIAVLQSRRCKPFGHYLHVSIVPRLVDLLAQPLAVLTDHIQRLCAYGVKCSLDEVTTAVKLSFPLDIFSSCLKAGHQATTMFALSGTGALRKSLAQRADLKFPVGKFYRWLIDKCPNKPLSDTTSVFFTAVMECVLEELVLRLVDNDNADVLSLPHFEEIMSHHANLISFFASYDPLSRNIFGAPMTFTELIEAVHSIRQKVVMETEGSLSGKSRKRAQIQLSRTGVRSLHYFTCNPGAYRGANIPLADWVRLIYAYAEYRMSYTVDEVDVQQASRVLLHIDCAPPSVPLWRKELPPDAAPHEAKQIFAFNLVSSGELENIRQAVNMLENDQAASKNPFGLCALAEAVVQTNMEAVQGLLATGWNPNTAIPSCTQDKRPFLLNEYTGWTPLTWAVAIQKTNIAKALLHSHASVDTDDMIKETPLQVAVQQGSVDTVRLLLDHSADPFRTTIIYDSLHADFRNAGCASAIGLAAARGQRPLIALLLSQLNEEKSKSLSMNDFLSSTKKLEEMAGKTEFETLSKETRLALHEAMYYAAETSRPEITVELKNSVNGLSWNIHTWIRSMESAVERGDKELLNDILTDFGPKLAAELSEDNVDHCLSVLFSVVRWECCTHESEPSGAAFTLSRLFHYFKETKANGGGAEAPSSPSHRSVIDPSYVNNQQLSDIRFMVEKSVIYGHRIVLVNASEKLRKLSQSPSGVVEITDVAYEIFLWLMEFVYTGRLAMSTKRNVPMLFELIAAAEAYGLPNLQTEAVRVLSNNIHQENVTELYIFAIKHGMSSMLESCEKFLLENFGSMLTDRKLQNLLLCGGESYNVSNALVSRLSSAFDETRKKQ